MEVNVVAQETPTQVDDLGRRASSIINSHLAIDREYATGKWVALRMSDGGSDGVLYDTRADAINHQLHEQYCCYIKITRDGITDAHARRFIELNRKLYDAGCRLADPDMPGEPIYPDNIESYIRKGIR
jgi:hypothetical protein